mmetsp:Transcript_86304/g.252492  ORF Transcript_86304/g.252492 Transcript_86304/m.252492 type:complete len:255 (+) Transcript_86304:4136-4900(+)
MITRTEHWPTVLKHHEHQVQGHALLADQPGIGLSSWKILHAQLAEPLEGHQRISVVRVQCLVVGLKTLRRSLVSDQGRRDGGFCSRCAVARSRICRGCSHTLRLRRRVHCRAACVLFAVSAEVRLHQRLALQVPELALVPTDGVLGVDAIVRSTTTADDAPAELAGRHHLSATARGGLPAVLLMLLHHDVVDQPRQVGRRPVLQQLGWGKRCKVRGCQLGSLPATRVTWILHRHSGHVCRAHFHSFHHHSENLG